MKSTLPRLLVMSVCAKQGACAMAAPWLRHGYAVRPARRDLRALRRHPDHPERRGLGAVLNLGSVDFMAPV